MRKDCKKCLKIVKKELKEKNGVIDKLIEDRPFDIKDALEIGTGVSLKQLKKWTTKYYGKKCKEFNPFCACCTAWRTYEDLKEMLTQ